MSKKNNAVGWFISYGQTDMYVSRDALEKKCASLRPPVQFPLPAVSPPGCQKNAVAALKIQKEMGEDQVMQLIPRSLGDDRVLVAEIQKADTKTSEKMIKYEAKRDGNAALGRWWMEGKGTKKEPYHFMSECVTTKADMKKIWKEADAAVRRLYEMYLVGIHHKQLRPAMYSLLEETGGFKLIGGGGTFFVPITSKGKLDSLRDLAQWLNKHHRLGGKPIKIRRFSKVYKDATDDEDDSYEEAIQSFNDAGADAMNNLIEEIHKEIDLKRKAGKSIGGRRFQTWARKTREMREWADEYETLLDAKFADVDSKRQILATVMTKAGGML